MPYAVTRKHASPFRIAAYHDQVAFAELSASIRHAVDTVLASLRASETEFGRCIAIYWDHEGDTSRLMSMEGCEVDVGWEVGRPYTDDATGVFTVETPEGSVATTAHVGPYQQLPEAHEAIRRWCEENGLRRLGANWEVYDHPREGEPPRTDVFYLVN